MQGVTFGMLTASVHGISFEELDLNNDGIVTTAELNSVFKEKNLDVLDLSTIDKNADQKVTKEEYILWDQESRMTNAITSIKDNISRDFVGYDRSDILNAIQRLDNYQKEFIANYTSKSLDITKMAEIFCSKLPAKYQEIKNDIANNNDNSIKNKVINDIVQSIVNNKNTASYFAENSKYLFVNDLDKEADRFLLDYKGNNLKVDLKEHLNNYLEQSDKSILADSILNWNNDKKDLENLPKELALLKAKNKAKAFIIKALQAGITIKLGNVNIRTEVEIMPALAQYKKYEILIRDLDTAIKNLSSTTKREKIAAAALNKEK